MNSRCIPWQVLWSALIIGFLAACSQARSTTPTLPETTPPRSTGPAQPTGLATQAAATQMPEPMATITILPSPAASTTATAIPSQPLCSPLAGYELEDLPGIVSNPFDPPAPGSDNPHQGVDLADRLPGSQASLTGREVQAVLAGRVAGLILDRFPYGNAVMVEVALSKLRSSDLDALALPTPLPQPLVNPALTCPPIDLPYPETPNRALYILYAHLADPPRLQIGQVVQCGEPLGSVGDSGNALNPHLHLEVRIGPAEARFTSLGHYANNLTADEMGLYCLWRVSGTFQVIDPLKLLALKP